MNTDIFKLSRFSNYALRACLQIMAIVFLMAANAFSQTSFLFPGMQAQTAPIPVTPGSDWPKAGDLAVTANQEFINDFNNHTGLIDSAFIKNIITFRINEDLPRMLGKPFTAQLTYRLYFTGKDGATYDSVSSDLNLNISYDTAKASTYNTSNSLVFYNGYQVKIKVISVDLSDTSLLKALEVDNTMVFRNYYHFTFTGSAVSTVNTITPSGLNPDELNLSWLDVTGVTGYDLEYTYVDSSSILSNRYGTRDDSAFYQAVFQNNATRVNLTDTFSVYQVPLLFEKGGFVYARIRSVQQNPNARRFESAWTYFPEFSFGGHQTNLNWQSQISFAEEGKRKAVVQYYDGSLKNRQTVTKDNSTRTTIVAENFYDNQGRPVIQVLPAPTLNTLIAYTPLFNSINNGEYDKTHFDRNKSSYVCGGGNSDSLSNNSGASKYYSPNNPQKTTGFNQFIPDAQDYPFSETRYMPDNTGRILDQGGVGKNHQLGSGHETIYYYTSPDQTELDGLFGTEVGNANHYFKNLVRDANGQYSVSYIDMHGRTIATALDGNLPDSIKLDYLSSKKDSILTKRMADSTNNILNDLSTIASKSFIITRARTATFTYNLPATTLVLNNCSNNPVNYACKYDLQITITDDCNNQKMPGQQPYVYTQTNISSLSSGSFSVALQEGQYLITKKLTINQASYDYYRDSVFPANNICQTVTTLRQAFIDSFQTSHNNCAVTDCNSCLSNLGTYTVFKQKFILQNGWDTASITPSVDSSIQMEYARQQADCNLLCPKDSNQVDVITSEMLQDMSPGGQYANPANIDAWSIFRSTGSIMQYQSTMYHYLDANGKTDTVYINQMPYLPNNLSESDFINNFKPSWAYALLVDHPEYSRLQYVISNISRASYAWDDDFQNTSTFQQAYAKGYLNPTGQSTFVHKFTSMSFPYVASPAIKDSFFILNSSQKTAMETKMQYYALTSTPSHDTISLWGTASVMGYCASPTDTACSNSNKHYPFADTSSCKGNADMAWKSFAQLYESYKQQLITTQITSALPLSTDLNIAFADGMHQSRFQQTAAQSIATSISGIIMNPAGLSDMLANEALVQTALSKQYSSNCANYAAIWWSELAPCTTTKLLADSAMIINDLISVCVKGSDASHTGGSSTIAPDSTNTYKSFDEVITHYVNLYDSTHDDQITTASCNAGLIVYPQAYTTTQNFTNALIYAKPDSCQCNRISGLYAQYTNLNTTYPSFSNYLQSTQGITMAESTLDSLMALCQGTITCNFLQAPIVIPPGLQCVATSSCLTCDQVSQFNKAYLDAYPDMVPVSDLGNADSGQTAINRYYEQYMNSHTGFNKAAADYLNFLSACKGTSGSLYDSLQRIMGDFKSRNLSTVTGIDSVHFHLAADYDDNTRLLVSDYPQVFAGGVAHVPYSLLAGTPYASGGMAMEKDDTVCVNNNFTIEARMRSDSTGLASSYCPGENFVFWDTYPTVAVSPTFEMPGTSGDCGRGLVLYNSGGTDDTTNLAAYSSRDLTQWMVLKMNFHNDTLKLYINDTLIRATHYSFPINRVTRYAMGSNSGYLDYVKIYDSLGNLQYSEQFEDCKQSPSNYPLAMECQVCQQSFTSFFNQRSHGSYTFVQIDSMYKAVCNYSANSACDSALTTTSDTLAQVVKIFNNNYNNYGKVYDQNGCDSTTWRVDYPGQDVNWVPHKDIFKNGLMLFPDSVNTNGIGSGVGFDFVAHDSACVNGKFSLEFRLKDSLPSISQFFMNLEVWVNSNPITSAFVRKKYYFTIDEANPSNSNVDFIDYEFAANNGVVYSSLLSQDITHWRTMKFTFVNNLVELYMDGSLITTLTLPSGVSPQRFYGMGIAPGSATGSPMILPSFDYIKGYDQNDSVFYDEEFNDCSNFSLFKPYIECPKTDCKSYFANTYNTFTGRSLTFPQIDSVYLKVTGSHPNCCGIDTSASDYCNQALLFNADTSRRRITIPLNGTHLNLDSGVCSFEMRIKPKKPILNAILPLISNRTHVTLPTSDGFFFFADTSGKIQLQLQGCPNWKTTSTPGVNIFDGKSHLVSAVKSRDSVAFYIDGILMPSAPGYCGGDPTTPVSSRFITTASPYLIGFDSVGGGNPMTNFNGWISEVRIWNTALSSSQVSTNMNAVLSPQPGLAGYYLMRSKDTCSQSIADLSAYTSSSLTLDGSGSTGSVTSYSWSKLSGPNTPIIVSPTSVATQVTGLVTGTYVFQLSINGGSSISQVSVYVNTTAPATASAGPNQNVLLPTSTVSLNGSGSTGIINSYAWSLVSGPNSPTIVSPSMVSTSVTGLIQGSYIFKLSVNGGTSTSQVRVYVMSVSTTSVFTTQTPSTDYNDGTPLELGMRFRSTSAGYLTGIRFYKTTANTGTHVGELYTNSGTRLAQATFTSETSSGWQTVLFSSPILIKPDTTYVAAYFSSAGNYTSTNGFFLSSLTNGPLIGLADGTDGANGIYSHSTVATFPTNTYSESNYGVDVLFTTSTSVNANAGSDQTISQPASSVTLDGSNSMGSITSYAWTKVSGPNSPTITSPSTAITTITGLIPGSYVFQLSVNSGSSVATVNVTVNAVSVLTANAGTNQTIPLPESTVTLNGSNSTGPVSSYSWSMVSGPNTPTITSPTSVTTNVTGLIQGNYLFQLSLNSGGSISQVSVSVIQLDTTYNIFTTQHTPTSVGNDGLPIELGVKFRTTARGYVTGVRFYKRSANTGTHIGELYASDGTRLAQATFMSETTSGWQTVLFSTPVAITPNTTYIAAYFSGDGNYSNTSYFFDTAVVHGPLIGLADGTDGVNGTYSYSGHPALPSSYYNKSNYWVDVLFATTKSAVANAGPNQAVSMTTTTVSNGVRGSSLSPESIDPVWLSSSQISFTGTDPVGAVSTCSVCQDTSNHSSPMLLCPDPPFILPTLTPVATAPCADSASYAAEMSTNVYSVYSDSVMGSFDSAYIGKCLQVASKELLTLVDSVSEYHYTLYYYDQAGNLVKTIPPAGVARNYSSTFLSSVSTARQNGTSVTPSHTLATNYRYNTLNQVMQQQTPDAGIANFWYDRLGRLSLSQNAKQLAGGTNYSYTLYDPIGRITEVGQINSGVGSVATDTIKVPSKFATWLTNNTTNRYQITKTIYDLQAPSGIAPWLIQNSSTLRNRVSYSSITPGQQGTNPVYATYYNYDIEGNVDTLLQDYGNTGPMNASGQEYKKIVYQYDLISGKVNSVGYQLGKPDAFMHFYQYDAENRLTDVYSTADSVTIEHEAHYDYYKHGPVGRSLIGQNQVQGIDYAYTLQGWLKSVNGSVLDSTEDMGHDGDPTVAAREYVGKDAYGFSLHYFDGDYQPINGSTFLTGLKLQLGSAYKGLYNGNISSMAVNIGILNNPKLYNYRYDQLNRLTGMDVFNGLNSGLNLWTGGLAATGDYQEKASYDENGNILTYIRHGFGSTQPMDSMTYHYNANKNQLNYIADGVSSGNYANDLDNQSANNYTYDSIGNLLTDAQAGITSPMTWSVYGKLLSVTNSSNSISYNYDAAGNRIGKTVGSTTTWYVRDAQGNVLSTYSGSGMPIQEQDLYGSSRLGMISGATALAGTSQYLDALGSGTLFTFTRGKKLFELTNHLGNVIATVSDKKFGTPISGIPSQISYYTADLKFAQDYYPGGMLMPGRQYNYINGLYRYGFNGQERSIEIDSNTTTAKYWEYDSRIGLRWNLDPKPNAGISPYCVLLDNPIWHMDVLGDSSAPHPLQTASDGTKDYIHREYEATVINSKQTSTQILKNIEINFNSFVPPDKGYFKKTTGDPAALKLGDEFTVIGGTSVGSFSLSADQAKNPEAYGLSSLRVGTDQRYHLGTIVTGVTVTSVKDNSFTFTTWKGHPEAGSITFSVSNDNKTGNPVIKIESYTSPNNAGYQFAYDYGGGKEIQTQLWDSFISNVGKSSGGQVSTPKNNTTEDDQSWWPW